MLDKRVDDADLIQPLVESYVGDEGSEASNGGLWSLGHTVSFFFVDWHRQRQS